MNLQLIMQQFYCDLYIFFPRNVPDFSKLKVESFSPQYICMNISQLKALSYFSAFIFSDKASCPHLQSVIIQTLPIPLIKSRKVKLHSPYQNLKELDKTQPKSGLINHHRARKMEKVIKKCKIVI